MILKHDIRTQPDISTMLHDGMRANCRLQSLIIAILSIESKKGSHGIKPYINMDYI